MSAWLNNTRYPMLAWQELNPKERFRLGRAVTSTAAETRTYFLTHDYRMPDIHVGLLQVRAPSKNDRFLVLVPHLHPTALLSISAPQAAVAEGELDEAVADCHTLVAEYQVTGASALDLAAVLRLLAKVKPSVLSTDFLCFRSKRLLLETHR